MAILVTGAAGFIASYVCKALIAKGYEVIGIDNLNTYYDKKLKAIRLEELNEYGSFNFEKVNIENKKALYELFKRSKINGIINLAARAGVRYSIEKPELYFSTNAMGTLNLLQCAKEFGIKKFVLASTSSLYSGHDVPYKEDMSTEFPLSPYAASKKAAEVLLYTYCHLYDIQGVVLRYFTVYGPIGRPDMSYFRFIKLISDGNPIDVYGDGTQKRDFTFVEDIADGTVKAFENDNLKYEIINLGNNHPYKLIDVINMIEEYLSKKAKINFLPFHKADMFETSADINKAKKLLKWQPKIKLSEGLKLTVNWFIQNKKLLNTISLKEGDENN